MRRWTSLAAFLLLLLLALFADGLMDALGLAGFAAVSLAVLAASEWLLKADLEAKKNKEQSDSTGTE